MFTAEEARKLSENAEELQKEKHRKEIYDIIRKKAEQGYRSFAFTISELRNPRDFESPLRSFMKKELEDLGYAVEHVDYKNIPDAMIVKW